MPLPLLRDWNAPISAIPEDRASILRSGISNAMLQPQSASAANIFLWDRLRSAPGVPAAFLEDFMSAASAHRRAVMAGGATKGEARNKPHSSTETSSKYLSVYNAVSIAAQSIVGAVVSARSCVVKGLRWRIIILKTHSMICFMPDCIVWLILFVRLVKWQRDSRPAHMCQPNARCQMISLSWRLAWTPWGLLICATPWQRSSLSICQLP